MMTVSIQSVAKKLPTIKLGLTTKPFAVNYIQIVTLSKLFASYSDMAEGIGSIIESENGSFQSQTTHRGLRRRASQAAASL